MPAVRLSTTSTSAERTRSTTSRYSLGSREPRRSRDRARGCARSRRRPWPPRSPHRRSRAGVIGTRSDLPVGVTGAGHRAGDEDLPVHLLASPASPCVAREPTRPPDAASSLAVSSASPLRLDGRSRARDRLRQRDRHRLRLRGAAGTARRERRDHLDQRPDRAARRRAADSRRDRLRARRRPDRPRAGARPRGGERERQRPARRARQQRRGSPSSESNRTTRRSRRCRSRRSVTTSSSTC